ncbi:hypothetical protein [Hymenobacter koreensis]|uniref:Outer membrane protein beta-barrel domain-containing protein n=1 Tax=Hymenobacter koreensis TaxID=1084523 RepID=A0ABP8IUW9_9BACT
MAGATFLRDQHQFYVALEAPPGQEQQWVWQQEHLSDEFFNIGVSMRNRLGKRFEAVTDLALNRRVKGAIFNSNLQFYTANVGLRYRFRVGGR